MLFSCSEEKFNNIIQFHELETPVLYFKLYNKTKYYNSYHGYVHMKNAVNSIHEYCKDAGMDLRIERLLILAAIFHDFNYVGIEPGNKNYDAVNIEAAIKAWETYSCRPGSEINEADEYIVRTLILYTQYPEYPLKDMWLTTITSVLETRFSRYLQDNENGLTLVNILRDADHSMPMYDNYDFLVWQFMTLEKGAKTYEEYMAAAGNYLEDLTFHFDFFQHAWETMQKRVIDKTKGLIAYTADHYPDRFGKEWVSMFGTARYANMESTQEI